jgi:hypothetical protein
MSPQSMAIEVLIARCPMGDPKANCDLWSDVDEQQFSTDVRLRWSRNGLRVGVVGSQLPGPLAKILDIQDAKIPTSDEIENAPVRLDEDARVVRRHMQVRSGQRSEIITSEIYPELPVLVSEGDQLTGQTYHQAQGMVAVRALAERDGRVRLELTPELHYGQPRQRWVGQQGMLRMEHGRERLALDSMAGSAVLAPGQMLVMTSLPGRSASVGHHFFAEKRDGKEEQKLLIVRVVQTQHDDLVAPSGSQPIDITATVADK